MTEEKPLFIPLKTEWFLRFEDGSKEVEYRAYGPRWNERTCRRGRKVILSHGYSGRRLTGTVGVFDKIERHVAPKAAQAIYPHAEFIAAIHIDR